MSAGIDLTAALHERLDDVLTRYIGVDQERKEEERILREFRDSCAALDDEARNLRLAISDLEGARITPGEANSANARRRRELMSGGAS